MFSTAGNFAILIQQYAAINLKNQENILAL
jgi:hypothetical protein